MKSLFFTLNVVLFAVLLFGGKATAQNFTNGDWVYAPSTSNEAVVVRYNGTDGAVLIPSMFDGLVVKRLGWGVFRLNGSISNVTVPDSVVGMDQQVFYGCSNLSSINLGNSLTNISDYSFNGCSKLTNFTIPSTVATIGEYAFQGCSNLTSVSIPGSVKNLGTAAFDACSKLTNVVLGDGVRVIGNSAFRNCSGITNIVIPNSVTNIAHYAFEKCSSLSEVRIPDSVVSIGDYAFKECTGLTKLGIGSGIKELGLGAFAVCTNLVSASIANGVDYLGASMFNSCYKLSQVNVPPSVTRIENGAFINTGLTHISLPAGLTNIGAYTFYGCFKLRSILFLGDAPANIGESLLDFAGDGLGAPNNFPKVYYLANSAGWSNTFAGRPAFPLSSSASTNSLIDPVFLGAYFDYFEVGSGGSLTPTTNGLSLSTTTSDSFAAGYGLKQKLSSLLSWTATVKCHVSEFSANQANPWFYGALALVKNGFTEQDIASNPILELKLVRTGENGLTNSVSWKNNSQDYTFYQDKIVPKDGVTDVFLSFSYVAENTTLSANISGDGVIFTNLTKWNLGEVWDVTPEDVFTVLVGAGHQPYGGASATHQVQQGDIYLRDLSVSFDSNSGSPNSDTDGDGLSDLAEQSLARLGFDWRVPQPQLVTSFMANAPTAGLFNQTQYDANRMAGITEGRAQVTGNPAGYGLYTSDSIMDLRMNGLMIQKQGTTAVVSFQPQTTTDLATQPFTNNGAPITNAIPMPGNKGFIRIRAN